MKEVKIEVSGFDKSIVIDFAAEELKKYLNKMFSVWDMNNKFLFKKDTAIIFDGYEIKKENSNIVISSGADRGILFGVYAFLRNSGCSFLFPGEENEVIPHSEKFDIDSLKDFKEEPVIEYRGLCFYNTRKETLDLTKNAVDWMAKNSFNFLLTSINRLDDTGCNMHGILWTEIGETILPELQKRGIVIDMSEHSTDYYFPKKELFKKHPQWFAQINGERTPGQICYSDKEAVNAYGDAIADFVKDKDYFKYIGIWPLDGGGYCECEKCRNPETIFNANKIIAEKIGRVRPDLTVEHLAYTPQSFKVPEEKMPRNMSVLVCHKRDETAYSWGRKAEKSGGAFYFEYMTGDHYRYRSDVKLNPVRTRKTVHALMSYGYKGIVSLYLPVNCTFQTSLNYYYMREFYFHPEKTVEDVSAELAAELFGKENRSTGKAVLDLMINKLFNEILWSGFSFSDDWFCEHIENRNKKLDKIHRDEFLSAYEEIKEKLMLLKNSTSGRYLKNTENMLDYTELQYLYYTCVDSYNADEDTEQKAEPYFRKLHELDKSGCSPFITEEYARWRITGRDNIFAVKKENIYGVDD